MFVLWAYSIAIQLRARQQSSLAPDSLLGRRIPEGFCDANVPEINLERSVGLWGRVVKEFLDPIFQAVCEELL